MAQQNLQNHNNKSMNYVTFEKRKWLSKSRNITTSRFGNGSITPPDLFSLTDIGNRDIDTAHVISGK